MIHWHHVDVILKLNHSTNDLIGSTLPMVMFFFRMMSWSELFTTGILKQILTRFYIIIILSMQSNPTASSVSSCWKIIGYLCERFPVLAFQGTSTIQPTEKNEFFPSILTVTSTESGVCSIHITLVKWGLK